MSTLGSAQRRPDQFDLPGEHFQQDGPEDARSELQREVAERLAAHRSRRSRQTGPTLISAIAPAAPKPLRKKSDSIAAAVAERYAHSPSYRDFLAAEAERAIEQANTAAHQADAAARSADAAAHVAARSAQAIVAAQQQLLDELESWDQPPIDRVPRTAGKLRPQTGQRIEPGNDSRNELETADNPRPLDISSPLLADVPNEAVSVYDAEAPAAPQPTTSSTLSRRSTAVSLKPADLTVRLYQDFGTRQPQAGVLHRSDMAAQATQSPADPEESFALDEEIEFRQAPIFEEPSGPPVTIPANLIEFPRQLVASRKARPRIAEGPLRDEAEAASATTQLRIFEVEPELISTQPVVESESTAPVWASILLDAPAVARAVFVEQVQPVQPLPPLEVAPLNLRLMAGIVDLCAIATTFLVALTAFALWANVLPSGLAAIGTAVAAFTVLYVLYNLLFFTFSDATPGMRYARLGLCTFDDENPTRSQMRRRTWAVLVAALPLGLGFLWSWMDGERLGWHDRLSRMYQRHY